MSTVVRISQQIQAVNNVAADVPAIPLAEPRSLPIPEYRRSEIVRYEKVGRVIDAPIVAAALVMASMQVSLPAVGLLLLAALIVRRMLWARVTAHVLPHFTRRRNVVVVGGPAANFDLMRDVRLAPASRFVVKGAVNLKRQGVPDLVGLLHDKSADLVVYLDDGSHPRIRDVVEACETEGVELWHLSSYPSHGGTFVVQDDLGGKLLQIYRKARPRRWWQIASKRLFDVSVASLALLVLGPLVMLPTALLIKLTSRGPVFFRQVRSGVHGRRFTMLKFRSMVVDAEARRRELESRNEASGPVFKIARDPRITAVGRFIRKLSIDELPQLINVLRGEMSVVGPRPPLPAEVAKYTEWQRRRLSVTPGLTCTWQVSGRNEIGFEDWMKMDLAYIDSWSLRQDLKLVASTVPAVLRGRGAS